MITPEEKVALDSALAQAFWEKDKALQDKEAANKVCDITRDELNKALEQVAALTSEKGEIGRI